MPCGCKKGAGMTVHGGGFKRKKRRRKKGAKGSGFWSDLNPFAFKSLPASIAGAYGRSLARRSSGRSMFGSKRGSGRVPGQGYYRPVGRKRGSGQHFLSGVTWSGYGKNKKTGSGRATFLKGVTWKGYPKTGSGMGFSGSGMSWTGSGLRGKRMMFRQGSGRRTV
ncbi:TPA: hypothetical protein EYO57_04815 [Candidatus Poribacteria bacterium]|nr:hypothetical protein [Candidatus Poribacteria bacterium]